MALIDELLEQIKQANVGQVQHLIAEGANLNCVEYGNTTLTLAINLIGFFKTTQQHEKLNQMRQIIAILLVSPKINVNLIPIGTIGPLNLALQLGDIESTALLLARGASLFTLDHLNMIPLDQVHMTTNQQIINLINAAIPCTNLTEINAAILAGDMRAAAYCFAHLYKNKPVDFADADTILKVIIDWVIQQDDINVFSHLMLDKILYMRVPLFSAEICDCIMQKIMQTGTTFDCVIANFQFTKPPGEEQHLLLSFNQSLTTEPVINEILNLFDNSEILHDSRGEYLKLLLRNETHYALLADLWIRNKSTITIFKRVFELIECDELDFVRYLFAEGEVDFNLVGLYHVDIFQAAIITANVAACRFFIEISPNYIPYRTLLATEFDCEKYLLSRRREIFILFCPFMQVMEANEYVQSTMQNGMIAADDVMLEILGQKFKAECVDAFSTLKTLNIITQHNQGSELESNSVAATDAHLEIVANKVYREAGEYDQARYQLFTHQYICVVKAIHAWAVEHKCQQADCFNTFLFQVLASQGPNRNALRHEMNFTSDTKRALELILYYISYGPEAAAELERNKPIIENLADQIHTCGSGARQAIQDCLIELDRSSIDKWLAQIKVDLVKRLIFEFLGHTGTNTHIVTWAMKYLQQQGFSMPLILFAATADELFDISTIFATEEECIYFTQQLREEYSKRYNLIYVIQIINEQLRDILKHEGGLINEYHGSASRMASMRALGMTYKDQADGIEKVYSDIFEIGPAASRLHAVYMLLHEYSRLDDPELVRNWTIQMLGPDEDRHLGPLDTNYLFISIDENNLAHCTVSFVNEVDFNAREVEIIVEDFPFASDIANKDYNKIYTILKEFMNADICVNENMILYRVIQALKMQNLLTANNIQTIDVNNFSPRKTIEILPLAGMLYLYLNTYDSSNLVVHTRLIPTCDMTTPELKQLLSYLQNIDTDPKLNASLDPDWIERLFDGRAAESNISALNIRPATSMNLTKRHKSSPGF